MVAAGMQERAGQVRPGIVHATSFIHSTPSARRSWFSHILLNDVLDTGLVSTKLEQVTWATTENSHGVLPTGVLVTERKQVTWSSYREVS